MAKYTLKQIEYKKQKIEAWKKQIAELSKSRDGGEKLDGDFGIPYNSGDAIINDQISFLCRMIAREQKDIMFAEIVDENTWSEDLVSLGDTVTLLMQFDGEEPYEEEVVLTDMDMTDSRVVTTSSPVGKAIYGQPVGSVLTCETPLSVAKIIILSKSHIIKR